MHTHATAIIFLQIKISLFIQEPERRGEAPLYEDPRNLGGTIEGCQIIIVSRRYLSRVHGDESSILLTLTLLDRRAKWPQRIPFSRLTVVTFGGPKFLTLQITSTRKRKSAVYFVCGQSRTSPSLLLVRARCWWSAVERFIEPFPLSTLNPLDFIAPIIISVQTETARARAYFESQRLKLYLSFYICFSIL